MVRRRDRSPASAVAMRPSQREVGNLDDGTECPQCRAAYTLKMASTAPRMRFTARWFSARDRAEDLSVANPLRGRLSKASHAMTMLPAIAAPETVRRYPPGDDSPPLPCAVHSGVLGIWRFVQPHSSTSSSYREQDGISIQWRSGPRVAGRRGTRQFVRCLCRAHNDFATPVLEALSRGGDPPRSGDCVEARVHPGATQRAVVVCAEHDPPIRR